MMDQLQDVESFLKNVDTISELVKELNSGDTEAQQKVVERADRYLTALEEDGPCKTKINKTTINTTPSPSTTAHALMSSQYRQDIDSENFMKTMERDAEDRMKRRTAKGERANELKDKGNEAYARQDYKMAVKHYSDGLAELRDVQSLYTNRAQAYIKLGRYQEAISDCEWALKVRPGWKMQCNERCIKAYVHMGKAYIGLRNYKESRNCFEKILEMEPGREKMVKEYLTQVEWVEERERQEKHARDEIDRDVEKATTVPQLLEKLSRPKQSPLYYCGGLELLSQLTADCTGQTLFRLNNGFSVINNNDTVRSCLSQNVREPRAEELCASVLRLWRAVCNGNDENQKMLMACPAFRMSIVDLLASKHIAVRLECLDLLCLYSQVSHSRRMAIDSLNLQMLVKNLMSCILNPKDQQENRALTILEKFASENKFCMQLQDMLTESVLVPFSSILRTINLSNQHVLPSLISSIGCLVHDDVIRCKIANSSECWDAFLVAMKQCSQGQYRNNLYPLLGVVFNISTVSSPTIQEHGVSLCQMCLGLLSDGDGSVVTRAMGVLSTVLPQCPAAVQLAIHGGVVTTMRRLLKAAGPTTAKYAIKTITVCTAVSHSAREELVKSDKRLSALRHLLESSGDELVCGNAALCLGHCLEVEGAARNLLGTGVVLLLLRHAAGNTGRAAVQQNAAIALGKLCRTEPRHMHKLRELHGIEILHSCMKLIT